MRGAVPLIWAAWVLAAQTRPPDTAEPHKPAGSIHGVIRDESSGAPLPEITVSVQVAQPPRYSSGNLAVVVAGPESTSDEEGRYALPALTPGTLHLTVGGKSVLLNRTVEIKDGEDLQVDFLVPRAPTVSGKAVDENNQPVVDAFVWLIQSEYEFGALRRKKRGPKVTGEDGAFTFDQDLEPGRSYYLLVDRDLPPEFAAAEPPPLDQREAIEAPTYYGDATSLEAAAPLVFRPGEQRQQADIKIRKARTYCAAGTISIGGKPVSEGFMVREEALTGSDLARVRSYSAQDGTFRVCGLTPGQYVLSLVNRPNSAVRFAIADADVAHLLFNANNATLQLETSWEGDPPADPKKEDSYPLPQRLKDQIASMPADQATELQTAVRTAIRMTTGPAGNEIWVRITSLGDGMGGPRIERARQMSPPLNLPAGDHQVDLAVAPGSYVKQVVYNGVAVADRVVHLAPGAIGTLRVVASQGAGDLSCQVSDGDGNALPGAFVVLVPQGADTAALLSLLAKTQQTDMTGNAAFQNLAPGKYRVLALTQPYRSIPEDLDKLLLAVSRAREVEIAEKGNVSVKLHAILLD